MKGNKSIQNSEENDRKSVNNTKQLVNDRSFIKDFCRNITVASVIWYIGACILFIIAFLALILSIVTYINDSTTESVVKLYGIIGASVLVPIAFLIVCIDCWIDGSNLYVEEATADKVFHINEGDTEAITMRDNRKKTTEIDKENPKILIAREKQLEQTPNDLPSDSHSGTYCPPPYHYHHHHFVPLYDNDHRRYRHYHSHSFQSHRPRPIHVCSPVSHHQSITRNDRQKPRDIKQNLSISNINSIKQVAPVSKNPTTIHKAKLSAYPQLNIEDVIRGTHIDHPESLQISTVKDTDLPDNITEIIHETTIVQTPRSLLPTLRRILLHKNEDQSNS